MSNPKPDDPGLPDRRARTRYPIALPVRYQVILANLHYGAFCWGKTVDFASRGFLIAADETPPPVGTRIRASADWPVPLDGTLPLQFVITGSVVHVCGKNFGVSFDSHDLRTLKKAPGTILGQRQALAGE